jgi:propionyl-CoA carboxylase alpha chain
MEQQRFRDGALTTGYIAEEFPDGFAGASLTERQRDDVIAAATIMMARREQRRSGASAISEWHVRIGDFAREVTLRQHGLETAIDDEVMELHWHPGESLARLERDGNTAVMKVTPTISGFRIRYRGADLKALVLRPHIAQYLRHMPVKLPPDMSRFLLCPMPGQVVRIDVAEGEVVEDGQPLAIVEAMKMENVLKAEKRARVGKIHVAPGAVLAVDQVMIEFEAV